MHPKNISIADYTYLLPEEKVAAFPLPQRDASRLLIYKDGIITEDTYANIATYLPENSLLVFNNTKVISARILFQKLTGGVIEIFCLEPLNDFEHNTAMQKKGNAKWKCMIGGASKWKQNSLIKKIKIADEEILLEVKLIDKLEDSYAAEFSWQPSHYSFAEIIRCAGETPLPPYIKRNADENDKHRYQTIYALYDGSVAAPTAGLHFTKEVFESFIKKNIAVDYVTLHVGAGTFKPVKSTKMEDHEMHSEWMDVKIKMIEALLLNLHHNITATGTTSLRTIESLYWLGVKTILNPEIAQEKLVIHQWDVYEEFLAENNYTSLEALSALIKWMKKNNLEQLVTKTQILISPGYKFKIANSLITNFHQPNSTLLLLVAAAVGDSWRKIYDYALKNDFRFLSYGDGSLLFIAQQ